MAASFSRDIWYYALPGHKLKAGKTVVKTFLDEPILFGRTNEGKVFALRDVCPHQAAPLSAGTFDGCKVACGFHGWQFDEKGSCVNIPSLAEDQQFDTSNLKAKSYPIEEVQGNIWIYMAEEGSTVVPDDVPQVPFFKEETPYQVAYSTVFNSDIDHAVVGLLDPAHIAFVHRGWLWRSPTELEDVVKDFEPSPYGFTMKRHPLEHETLIYKLMGRDPEVEISFRIPGIRIEHVRATKNHACSMTTTTPISETETEVTTLLYTTMPWIPLFKPVALWFARSFLGQDQAILVKQQSRLKYADKTVLIGDSDVQARWYYRLKKERAESSAEARPFKNPVRAKTLHWRS